MKVLNCILGLALASSVAYAQVNHESISIENAGTFEQQKDGSWKPYEGPTKTDIFVMEGTDFDSPGLVARGNYNIGIGHSFDVLKHNPVFDEVTFAYSYESAGPRSYWHSRYGEHTEQLGLMKNFPVYKSVAGYGWLQDGVTSYTGYRTVENRNDFAIGAGLNFHLSRHNAIWLQENFNKVNTVPYYTTTSIGYTFSF